MKKFFESKRNAAFAAIISITLIVLAAVITITAVQHKKGILVSNTPEESVSESEEYISEMPTALATVSASEISNTSVAIPNETTSHKTKTKPAVTVTTPFDDKENNPLFQKYDEMNRKYPIEDGSTWVFYSSDPKNIEPYVSFPCEKLLAVYYFKVDADLHTEIWYEYYAPLDMYKEEYTPEMVKRINGADYVWQMTSMIYEGGCFPCLDGTVDIELRCYDEHGAFLVDELRFWREDENTLRLLKNNGKALYLQSGNTFRRCVCT